MSHNNRLKVVLILKGIHPQALNLPFNVGTIRGIKFMSLTSSLTYCPPEDVMSYQFPSCKRSQRTLK